MLGVCQCGGGGCIICNGRGYNDYSKEPWSYSPPPLESTPRRRLSAVERDHGFATLLGFALALLLLWIGYTRGFGLDWYWNYLIPIGAGWALAAALRRLPWITRPLRWLATACLIGAIAWAAFAFLGAVGSA